MPNRKIPQAGELYRHFKGNMYQILGIAKHSETQEELVVYQALYGDFGLYVRPVEMFLSETDRDKYPEVSAQYRFTLVEREELSKAEEALPKAPLKSQEEAFTEAESKPQKEALLPEKDLHPEASLVNEDLMTFLDARDYGEKLEVLYSIRKRIDERLMSDIEMSLDLMPGKGSIEERIMIVRDNLQTLSKFETRRLR